MSDIPDQLERRQDKNSRAEVMKVDIYKMAAKKERVTSQSEVLAEEEEEKKDQKS